MGQEKGLIPLGGVPMVGHVLKTVSSVADETIISVARGMTKRYADSLGSAFRIVEDEREGFGPLGGLSRALEVARGEYVLVSPCDTPFIRPEVCRYVASVAVGSDAAVPVVRGHLEPLHGVYLRVPSLSAFRKILAKGEHRPIEAYEYLRIQRVEEAHLRLLDPELDSFWNLNSPDDLRLAEKKLGMSSR